MTAPQQSPAFAATPARDEGYYKEDGNVVLWAEQTLFKVHRSMLTEMSPVFADMLQLPQGDAVEGAGDALPIMLAGDLAVQVRSLLWALYARPDEVKQYLSVTPVVDQCHRLLHIVAITHKYQSPGLMQWALDLAAAYFENASLVPVPPPTLVTALMRLYALDLPGFTAWGEPAVKRSALTAVELLRMAADSHWTKIECHAYYRVACAGNSAWSTLRLTGAEYLRLLTGYANLNETWTRVPDLCPPMLHLCAAGDRTRCREACARLWRDICSAATVRKPGSRSIVDIQAKLDAACLLLDRIPLDGATTNNPSWGSVTYPCKPAFKDTVRAYAASADTVIQRCFDPRTGLLDHSVASQFPISSASNT